MEIRAGRRFRTKEERRQIVEETLKPEVSVAQVALAHGINANQIFHWRRQYHKGWFDNVDNESGQALRADALGRKNYLFAGSNAGGERAAAMYSLIGSAKLNDLDPEAYLSNVLSRIADHPIQRISELLPWNIEIPKTAAVATVR